MGGFIFDESGNFETIQGDSGHIIVEDIPKDKNYTIFLGVQNSKREPVGSELYLNSNQEDTVDFFLSGEYTDQWTVPKNKETETYYYAVKICYIAPEGSAENSTEDTAVLNDNDISFYNEITVYPRRVKGIPIENA